jgi:hypothetical protein
VLGQGGDAGALLLRLFMNSRKQGAAHHGIALVEFGRQLGDGTGEQGSGSIIITFMICSSSGRVAKSSSLMGMTDEAGFVLGVGLILGLMSPWRTEKPWMFTPSSQARGRWRGHRCRSATGCG